MIRMEAYGDIYVLITGLDTTGEAWHDGEITMRKAQLLFLCCLYKIIFTVLLL